MMETVRTFLTEADLVKFAKVVPAPADNEQVIPVATAIVRKTKPTPAPVAEPAVVEAAPSQNAGEPEHV
jgi:hypothetical protein